MATYYAWSRFLQEKGIIEPGDTVTQDKLKVPNAEWEELVRVGAVRTEEYPSDLPPGISPAEHYRAMEASGEMTDEELLALNERLGRGVIRDSGTVSGQIVNEDTAKAVAADNKGAAKSGS